MFFIKHMLKFKCPTQHDKGLRFNKSDEFLWLKDTVQHIT